MPITFQPDKYNVQVIHRWTSNTGRWIVFLGQHYDGNSFCWDVGAFQTTTGACQRFHFKENKTGATIEYDNIKEQFKKIKGHTDEDEDRYTVLGPDGRPTN